jgi:OmpA-OmpF porin, OOP family
VKDIKLIVFLLLFAFAGHSQTDTTRLKGAAGVDSTLVKEAPVKPAQPDSTLAKETPVKAAQPDSTLVKETPPPVDSTLAKEAPVKPLPPDSTLVKKEPAKASQPDSTLAKKAVVKTPPPAVAPVKVLPPRPSYGSPEDSLMIKNASGKTLKRLGKNAIQQNDPSAAITFFEAYLRNNRSDAVVMYLLGHAYLQIRDYDRAQQAFLNAYITNKEKAPEALYYHAQMQKSNGLYDSAKVNFQKFKKEYKGDEKNLKKMATREIQLCDSVQKLVATENKIIVLHLDSTINKINTEGAPVAMDENTLLFTSLRTEKKEYITEGDSSGITKRRIYVAKRDTGGWHFDGEFSSLFNDPNFNTGNACFSPDRNRIYFTKCRPNFKEKMSCAIYVSEKTGDTWSEPVKLPKNINNPKFTATMPAVTTDPAKGNEVIYFVSNREEGKGGMDIWYTVYDKKNKVYKSPRNAGTKINSSGDEISPYFDNETRTLYFSSDGLGGLGGYDVFKATGDGKKWLATENVGQPINTGADDIFYTISVNREEGFFVSNRKGGNALKNSTCCDDIYYYKRSEYVRIQLKGTVAEVLDPNMIVPFASIEVYLKDKKTQEKVLVKNITADSLGNYLTSLEADKEYMLIVKKADFLGTTSDVSTAGITQSRIINKSLALAKKPKEPIRIPNIQYEFDKSNILEASKMAIDTTIFALMEANPELIIEIQSHTDSKGNDLYNEKLSQKRAESVVSYLVSKGIQPERLKAKGYGEKHPVAPNENSDGSDNPEGRAQNRRTDFKIIGVLDAEIINAATGLEDD